MNRIQIADRLPVTLGFCLMGLTVGLTVFSELIEANNLVFLSVGFFSTGMACFLAAWAKARRFPSWLPLATVAAILSVTVILWNWVLRIEDAHFKQNVSVAAEDIRLDMEAYLNDLFNALARIKYRWDYDGGTPHEKWSLDAKAFLKHGAVPANAYMCYGTACARVD